MQSYIRCWDSSLMCTRSTLSAPARPLLELRLAQTVMTAVTFLCMRACLCVCVCVCVCAQVESSQQLARSAGTLDAASKKAVMEALTKATGNDNDHAYTPAYRPSESTRMPARTWLGTRMSTLRIACACIPIAPWNLVHCTRVTPTRMRTCVDGHFKCRYRTDSVCTCVRTQVPL